MKQAEDLSSFRILSCYVQLHCIEEVLKLKALSMLDKAWNLLIKAVRKATSALNKFLEFHRKICEK